MTKISHLMLTAAAAACVAGSLCAQSIPDIAFDSTPNFLKLPADNSIYLGEVAGAAYDSKGNVFVFTRTGNAYATIGTSRTLTHGGGRILEFDPTGKYMKEIGKGLYGILVPNAIRIDPQDNIWLVDRGASLVIKFDPQGRVIWPMGRKPEAINVSAPAGRRRRSRRWWWWSGGGWWRSGWWWGWWRCGSRRSWRRAWRRWWCRWWCGRGGWWGRW